MPTPEDAQEAYPNDPLHGGSSPALPSSGMDLSYGPFDGGSLSQDL